MDPAGRETKSEESTMIQTVLRLPSSLGLVLLLGCTVARAGTIALGTWYEFSFFDPGTPAMGCAPADPSAPDCIPSSGTGTTFADAAPWTFAVNSPGARLTVTDVFYHGDAFDVFDSGTLIGSTASAAAADFLSCGDDPGLCLSDPLTSKGTFLLDPSFHAISIVPNASAYGAGVGYFRVDAVPEPGTCLLVAAVLVCGVLRRYFAGNRGGAQ